MRIDGVSVQAQRRVQRPAGRRRLLHDGTETATGCRGRAEVEAESVAYLVCAAAVLDTDGYFFP